MANQEQLALLKQGVEGWNKWREDNRQTQVDLSGANLSKADLSGANLSKADLSGADLSKANLSGANLIAANLFEANLFEANFRKADVSGANFRKAKFIKVDFSETVGGINICETDVVRLDPERYVDDTTARGLHSLVIDIVRAAIEPAFMNACTTLHVILREDGSLIIADDGRGIPVVQCSKLNTRPRIEAVMTTSYGGAPGPVSCERFGFLFNRGPIINALSESLTIETIIDGNRYVIGFERGHTVQTLQNLDYTKERGTRIHLRPDPTIWTEPQINSEVLYNSLQQLALEYPTTKITLQDEQSGKVITFKCNRKLHY